VATFDPHGYSNHFFSFVDDVDLDGQQDILVIGFPGKDTILYKNPGKDKRLSHWPAFPVFGETDNESPTYADLTADGREELICMSGGKIGYASPDPKNPVGTWGFHAVTEKSHYQRFSHGLGYGDLNSDGHLDLIEKDGWWENPGHYEGDPLWRKHSVKFADAGAQMHAFDIDGDGDNDVVTSYHAHGYGLVWFENQSVKDGEIQFKRHVIMGERPEDNEFGIRFSQLHALAIADMNQDGVLDLITGKRYWAHGPKGDVEPNAPAVLYWFQTVRSSTDHSVRFIPHKVDDDSGVGTQVSVGYINGDSYPDIMVGNKKGTFVFLSQTSRKGDK
jgi:hypothetical protein